MDFIDKIKKDILENNAKKATKTIKTIKPDESEVIYWIYKGLINIDNEDLIHLIAYMKEGNELLCVEEMAFPMKCKDEEIFKEFIYRSEEKLNDYFVN